jgi:hypothetical protein
MKKTLASIAILIMTLSACGTYTDTDVTPLDDSPTPSCVAIESVQKDDWDSEVIEEHYVGRYCLETE